MLRRRPTPRAASRLPYLALAVFLALTACSSADPLEPGDGGDTTDPINQPPNASAISSVDASIGESVTLDASASRDPEGGALTYSWKQISGPNVGSLTGATPTFTAPDEVTTLEFELVVSDGTDESDPVGTIVYVLEDKDRTIFVDASAGDDGNAGTRQAPFATIAAAIAAAAADSSDVYLAAGSYAASVELESGVSLYGGYQGGSWRRDPQAYPTDIMGGPEALSGESVSDLTVEGLGIHAAAGNDPNQPSSMAVRLRRSTGIRIRNNRITAGTGLPGADGTPGADGEPGKKGGNGDDAGACTPPNAGGNGGASPVYPGGKGGSGGALGGLAGSPGQGPKGGPGGDGGSAGFVTDTGDPGGDGGHGDPGANGDGGMSFGDVSGGRYVPANGGDGADGSPGSGGGGGGGGNGSPISCGAGGGGGGGGGGAGRGGTAGRGGGGSIGILLADSSQAEITGNSITTADGGRGGRGGLRGDGADGGFHGFGGDGGGQSGSGGYGGDGGDGGDGGHGGGGGGGPSIGILEDDSSSSVRSDNTIVVGSGGAAGPSFGNIGQSGLSLEYLKT